MPSPDQIRIITVVAFALLMLFGVKRPVYMAAAYMVLVYCQLSIHYPVFGQIRAEFLFAVLFLLRIAAAGSLFGNLSFKTSSINKYMFWFVLCVALSFAVAWDFQRSWEYGVYFLIKTLFLYVMIVGSISSEKDLWIFVWAFILMYAYLAYEPTFNYLTGSGGDQQVYGVVYVAETGILAGHVALANNVNQMLPIVAFLFFGSRARWQKMTLAVCFLVFFTALVASSSRGGVVGLAVWAGCIVWYSEQRERAALVTAALLVVLLIGSSLGGTLLDTAVRISGESVEGRMTGLSRGLNMLRNGNILGVGPGCFGLASLTYFHSGFDAHNLYGEIIGELGIPGMVVTFLLMREVFKSITTLKNRLNTHTSAKPYLYYLIIGIQVSLITRLVTSMASHGVFHFYWYVMAALVIVTQKLVLDEQENGAAVLRRKAHRRMRVGV